MVKGKIKNRKGFTLAELLIVVAIIAILIAIMVPVFGASRDSAILARDAANLRSAYAEAVATAMTDSTKFDDEGKLEVDIAELKKFDCTLSVKDQVITVTSPKGDKNDTITMDDDVELSENTTKWFANHSASKAGA